MKKKKIWTIELPGNATRTGMLYSAIQQLGGEVTNIDEKICDLTDEECQFWCGRWGKLPNTNYHPLGEIGTVYTVRACANGKLRIGIAKCRKNDTFNPLFGRALADARCFGDRKLERALLRFTPEQIKKYF